MKATEWSKRREVTTAMSGAAGRRSAGHWMKAPGRGQTAVLFALACPVIIGMLSLSVDVGIMYFNWQKLQSAADAAVLAGASALPGDPATAMTDAQQYASSNGVQSTEITATKVSADDDSITISIERTVPTYFARVLGRDSAMVKVAAVAGVESNPNGTSGLVPIGLSCTLPAGGTSCNYTTGMYQLKSSQIGPGNWGPVELGGTSGGSAYETYLQYGYNGTMSTTLPTETGNVVGPTGQAISYRISEGEAHNQSASYLNPPAYDPRLVTVPLIQYNDANGKKPVTVVGYAEAWLVSLADNNNTINLYFIGFENSPQYSLAEENFGLNHPVLLK